MEDYLITSREGLYHFNKASGAFKFLRPGKFFGICYHCGRWYTFRFKGHKNAPTDNGIIESFVFDREHCEISDVIQVASNLDNGSHQMIVYKEKLYLLETYHQRIRVFDINEDGTLSAYKLYHPTSNYNIKNAWYVLHGMDATSEGYLHMNAIAIQDDFVYINCAMLRNHIENGAPSHKHMPNKIMVFDMNFEYLWSHVLDGTYACHDCVFLGHYIYLTCPLKGVIRYSIVKKEFEIVYESQCEYPRGLSIHPSGDILYGSRQPGQVRTKKGCWNTPSGMAPCCIVNLDADYNDYGSDLHRPYVIQKHAREGLICIDVLSTIKGMILRDDWSMQPSQDLKKDDLKRYTTERYTFEEIIQPPADIFGNLRINQVANNNKIRLEHVLQDSEVWRYFSENVIVPLESKGFKVTGRLFLYPPGYHLGWHTNLESSANCNTYRCYTVMVSADNESFFLYKHPFTQLIHAIPDRDMHMNIFCLGSKKCPLWHAVVNNSTTSSRLAIGFGFDRSRKIYLRIQ